MNADRATILFVDDEERILRSLRMLFRGRHEVLAAGGGAEALAIVRSRPVHVVVSDQRMPQMTGVELLRQVRASSPATMRLLLTGYADLAAVMDSVNEGEIFRFLEKPWQSDHLVATVAEAAAVALRTFAVHPIELAQRAAAAGAQRRTLLVLDEDDSTCRLVRELAPPHDVRTARDVETALALLGEHDVAVVVTELRLAGADVAGALKSLKRYSPSTLTIALSPLRDARTLIELINQGQVYRFLPKPVSRELLRRSLQAALAHHAQTRAAPVLLRRHAVEEPKFEPLSLSAKLLDYWRRIRDNHRARVGE